MWVICVEDRETFEKKYLSGFDVAQGRLIFSPQEEAAQYESAVNARDDLDVVRPIILSQMPRSTFFIDEL